MNDIESQNETDWKTVREWQDKLETNSFVYDHLLSNYQKRLDRLLLIIFICGILGSVLNTLMSGLLSTDEEKYKNISRIINFILIAVSVCATSCSKYISHTKVTDTISDLSDYIPKLDTYLNDMTLELQKPISLRKNNVDYILEHSKKYLEIINSAPKLDHTEYTNGVLYFIKFKKDNTDFNQYF